VIIDVDVGNSRIKWRALVDKKIVASGSSRAFDETLRRDIERYGVPDRVRLSNVADAAAELAVEAASEHWGASLQKAVATREAAGVSCGYENPATMGVDRWLAVLAARHLYRNDCVVVDVGSAVTVDLVTASGEHLGGYIVPGLSMMRQSLLGGTARVRVEEARSVDTSPGRTTQQAVDHGCLLAVCGLVDTAVKKLSVQPGKVKVLVTGGDGELLLPLLEGDVMYQKDLVMDGLAVLFP